MTITVGSLCSGYDALSLGLHADGTNHHLAFVADNDPAAAKILAHHHPTVPNLGDITTVNWATVEHVDLLTATFPCTDLSTAGRRGGLTKDRVIPAGIMNCGCPWADHQMLTCTAEAPWGATPAEECDHGHIDQAAAAVDSLNEHDRNSDDGPPPERVVKGTRSGVWAHIVKAINVLHPPLVYIENVPGILSTWANRSNDVPPSDLEPGPAGMGNGPDRPVLRALGAVLGDLADLGYDTVWVRVSAASVGTPHLRHRIFILAWNTRAEPRARNILNHLNGPATNPESVGHRNGGQAGREGVGVAPVGGAVRPDGLSLLPTPAARLSERWGQPNAQTDERRMYEEGRRNLDDAIALLPTPAARDSGRGSGYTDQPGRPLSETILRVAPPDPAVALLSTPVAHDTGRSPDAHLTMRASIGSSSVTSLAVAAALLPTPTVADSRGTRNATSGRTDPRGSTNTNGWTLVDVAFTDRWGEYAPAIARWEILLGRPAPNPTKPGRTGRPRLSARFVEWLQGLPDGYVTSLVGSNDALRLLGNSNPPQQYAAAWRQLTATVGQLLMSKDAA
jgi:site-specific DNA-cytosine methylase